MRLLVFFFELTCKYQYLLSSSFLSFYQELSKKVVGIYESLAVKHLKYGVFFDGEWVISGLRQDLVWSEIVEIKLVSILERDEIYYIKKPKKQTKILAKSH